DQLRIAGRPVAGRPRLDPRTAAPRVGGAHPRPARRPGVADRGHRQRARSGPVRAARRAGLDPRAVRSHARRDGLAGPAGLRGAAGL
ncbi:MAG: hypothetical protein AVDCRST_MAG57-2830, partial [uncultured Blastococcus sp.]